MYKLTNSFDIISLENEQCSCFGTSKRPQDQFLARQKYAQPTPIHQQPNKLHQQALSPKPNCKKSLKKQFTPLSQNASSKVNSTQKNIEIKPIQPAPKIRQIREFLSPQSKISTFSQKMTVIPEEPIHPFYSMKVTPKQIISCKNIQQSSPQLISAFQSYNPRMTKKEPYVVKVKHTQKVDQTPLVSFKSQQKRDLSPISNKSMNRQHQTVCSTIHPEKTIRVNTQLDQVNQPQTNKIKSRAQLHQFTPLKQEAYKSCVKFATMKSIISPSKTKNETLKSKIEPSKTANFKSKTDTKKSIVQTNRSRIQIKSLRMEKNALKKMDDVIQIYSLPDSQERSDSDKESVVVGRLNEYGSMIDPQISTSVIEQARQEGKLMRMNSVAGIFGEHGWKLNY